LLSLFFLNEVCETSKKNAIIVSLVPNYRYFRKNVFFSHLMSRFTFLNLDYLSFFFSIFLIACYDLFVVRITCFDLLVVRIICREFFFLALLVTNLSLLLLYNCFSLFIFSLSLIKSLNKLFHQR